MNTLEIDAKSITFCRSCGGPLTGGETRSIQFYRVQCDTFIPNLANLQQRQGLEIFFGSGGADRAQAAGIAGVFAPSKVADGIPGKPLLFCFGCVSSRSLLSLLESVEEDVVDGDADA